MHAMQAIENQFLKSVQSIEEKNIVYVMSAMQHEKKLKSFVLTSPAGLNLKWKAEKARRATKRVIPRKGDVAIFHNINQFHLPNQIIMCSFNSQGVIVNVMECLGRAFVI